MQEHSTVVMWPSRSAAVYPRFLQSGQSYPVMFPTMALMLSTLDCSASKDCNSVEIPSGIFARRLLIIPCTLSTRFPPSVTFPCDNLLFPVLYGVPPAVHPFSGGKVVVKLLGVNVVPALLAI